MRSATLALRVGMLLLAARIVPCDAELLAAPPAKVATRRTEGTDWPRFLGPTGDNKSSERGIKPWPAAGPAIVWQMTLGTGYGPPAVSEGRLFQFDRKGTEARLRAVESETGQPLWEFKYPTEYVDLYGYDNGPRCSPVIDDGRVFIFGVEGMLHCLDAATGKLLWKVDTARDFGVISNFFGVGSTPVISGDKLLVQVGGSPPESVDVPPGQLDKVRPNGSAVVAFDKRTGQVVYQLGDDLASYSSPALATIGDRPWCFVFARSGLLGFDPAAGKVDFEFPWRSPKLESVNASNPVIVGDQVFISETYGPGSALIKVRPGSYDEVWTDAKRGRDKALQTHWNTPIHVDGYLYASSGRHDSNAELRAVELATGKVCWSEPGLARSTLLYVDGYFVCLSESGALRLLRASPEKFDEVSHVVLMDKGAPFGPAPLLHYPSWAPPVLSHGLLYVRGNGRLVCLDLIPAPAK